MTVLPSYYLAPISWYRQMNSTERVLVDGYENFQKQTLRNRCVIATANGPQNLSIPIERPHGEKIMMKDMRISHHCDWQRQHWHAIETAYGESAFFDYYADDLRPFYEQPYNFLYDLNEDICRKICELIDIPFKCERTTEYIPHPSPLFAIPCASQSTSHPYYQVYKDKTGFLPDLSILDLLLNMGPESILYI